MVGLAVIWYMYENTCNQGQYRNDRNDHFMKNKLCNEIISHFWFQVVEL